MSNGNIPNPANRHKMIHVAECYTSANDALRDLIRMQDAKIACLDKFDAMVENFKQFKEMAMKHDRTARELKDRLNLEEAKHRKAIEELRMHVAKLSQSTEQQTRAIEVLEGELKDSVERSVSIDQKMDFSNNNYSNGEISQLSFINRLYNDCK